ncbi:MAG: Flp pilus assembly protein CpaB [Anaerolineae bacterium]|nr:Flp pilus assembly protein CpaB [Anaerolineae bacterium]
MRNRRTLMLVVLIVLAIALLLGYFLLQRRPAPQPEAEMTPTVEVVPAVPVVIARNNLDRGMKIQEGMVETWLWPSNRLPPLYYTDVNQVYGKIVRVPIAQGEPIMPTMLTEETLPPEEWGSDISLRIPEGKRLIAVPIDLVGAIAWYLKPGDRVDILASWNVVDLDRDFQSALPNNWIILQCGEGMTCQGVLGRMEVLPTGQPVMVYPSGPGRTGYIAQVTIQNALVMGIGPYEPTPEPVFPAPTPTPTVQAGPTGPTGPVAIQPTPTPVPVKPVDVVLLLLDAQDTLVMKSLLELKASITLVMRGYNDHALLNTEPVTLDYLVNRYGIGRPPKLPFGVEAPELSPLQQAYINWAIGSVGAPPQE